MDKAAGCQSIRQGQYPLRVLFFPKAGDQREKPLKDFIRKLESAGIPLDIDASKNLPEGDRPAFCLSGNGPPRHFYQAVPEGKEWPPFLQLIQTLSSGKLLLSPVSLNLLEQIDASVSLRVLITSGCPFCAQVVGLVNQTVAACPSFTARITDVGLFPEMIQRYRPKAAPVTIIGEEIFLTGQIREEALMDWLEKAASKNHGAALYRNDLLEKRMAEALNRLKDHPEDIPLIAGLMQGEEFGIKIGAMALVEQIIEEAPNLQLAVLQSLRPLLKGSSEQVAGDAAYLIGLLQIPEKIPVLEGLLGHPNPELVEIAREGLADPFKSEHF
jgi:hypothetical protein